MKSRGKSQDGDEEDGEDGERKKSDVIYFLPLVAHELGRSVLVGTET